ncbi:MAG: IS66 family transposase [Leptolyngbyaceae cyanobacterium CSU_1_3]|nr:IS66 family transposase [Leptolyngbyaceae cyanobacterium CSU_1_3]
MMYTQAIKQPATKPSYEELEDMLEKALARIAELEKLLEKYIGKHELNSRNSSKPPSSDEKSKAQPKSERVSSGLASGGQKDHIGYNLVWLSKISQTLIHAPLGQCECGIELSTAQVTRVEERQVIDIPKIELEATVHRKETRICRCGRKHEGEYPKGVEGHVQYGNRIRGQAVYLLNTQFISLERCQRYFDEMYQVRISQGTLVNWQQAAYRDLEAVESQIRQALSAAEVAHGDETGIHVGGELEWWHSFSTASYTHYHVATQRGLAGMKLGGIVGEFKGILSHDCWSAYFKLPCLHALCNAHLLRELTRVIQISNQTWASKLKTLLRTMKNSLEENPKLPQTTRILLQQQFRELVAQGLLENPAVVRTEQTKTTRGAVKQSFARSLLLRLERYQDSWLRFLFDARVPFDNNLAERDVRMVKVREKVSGGSRGAGAVWFARIRGYVSTLRKQNQNVYQALVQLFAGNVVLPASLILPNTS